MAQSLIQKRRLHIIDMKKFSLLILLLTINTMAHLFASKSLALTCEQSCARFDCPVNTAPKVNQLCQSGCRDKCTLGQDSPRIQAAFKKAQNFISQLSRDFPECQGINTQTAEQHYDITCQCAGDNSQAIRFALSADRQPRLGGSCEESQFNCWTNCIDNACQMFQKKYCSSLMKNTQGQIVYLKNTYLEQYDQQKEKLFKSDNLRKAYFLQELEKQNPKIKKNAALFLLNHQQAQVMSATSKGFNHRELNLMLNAKINGQSFHKIVRQTAAETNNTQFEINSAGIDLFKTISGRYNKLYESGHFIEVTK